MNRRDLIKLGAAGIAAGIEKGMPVQGETASAVRKHAVEQWGMFEVSLEGPANGNPFKDVSFAANFTLGHRSVHVKGFYDGNGLYRVRFMPDAQGEWEFVTESTAKSLMGHTGSFQCIAPGPENHGPVTTARQFHFEFADGKSYLPFGTTTYAFLFTGVEHAAASLLGMRGNFNKTRACVLPKPLGAAKQILPFPVVPAGQRSSEETNDYSRFNPDFFQLVEKRILLLQAEGIEADCILFHPYDAWGYKAMPPEADDFYLRYVVARLSAYRNVWWSVANEYDLVKTKSMSDWDRFFRIIQEEDPYSHLRSIHHSRVIYDHSKPWCTHASLQSYDFERSAERRKAWNKPIIYDEIQYEGDVDRRWGNLSAEEMTHRFWLATVRGSYASHGEVFRAAEKGSNAHEPSWSDAGRLRGESASRIAFLCQVVREVAGTGLNAFEESYYLSAGIEGKVYLWYFDFHRPAYYSFPLPNTANFKAVLIDPIAMTQTELAEIFSGTSRVELPSKPYHAIVFRKVSDAKGKLPEKPLVEGQDEPA